VPPIAFAIVVPYGSITRRLSVLVPSMTVVIAGGIAGVTRK
jgi:hypothetical protein